MKIALVYNEKAGDGLSAAELRHDLVHAGHEIIAMLEHDEPLGHTLDRAELVVVAGGDGTVRRIALDLAGHRGEIPLAVLPRGTANNIGTSLGVMGELRATIGRWDRGAIHPLDLGHARGPFGERHFIESVGGGLVAEGIAAMDSEEHPETEADAMLRKALGRFRSVLSDLRPRRCQVELDGQHHEMDLLLFEALNIRSIGPNLVLCGEADPFDGELDVVFAGEAERAALDRYLAARIDGRIEQLDLPARRARRLRIAGLPRVHVDDEVIDAPGAEAITIRIQPGSLRVLC